MLFVFGYRAQKIRSKKISVLIHDSEKSQNIRQTPHYSPACFIIPRAKRANVVSGRVENKGRKKILASPYRGR
jgi:hypothetical protein